MSDNPNPKIVLGYEVDSASQKKVEASAESVARTLNGVAEASKKASQTSEATALRIAQGYKSADDKAAAYLKRLKDVTAEIRRQREEAEKKTKQEEATKQKTLSSGAGLAAAGGSLLAGTGAGAALIDTGAVIRAVAQINKLGEAAGGLGGLAAQAAKALIGTGGVIGNVAAQGFALGGSFGALAGALGPLALLAGGLVIGLTALNNAMAAVDQQAKSLINTQDEYFKLISKGTTEDLQNAVERAKDDTARLRAQRDELQKIIAGTFEGLQADLGDAAARATFGRLEVSTLKPVYEQLDRVNQSLSDSVVAEGRYEGALKASATATNDAAAIQERNTKVVLDALGQQMSAQIEAQNLARTGTTQAVNARKQSIEDEIDIIRKSIPVIEQHGGSTEEGAKRLQALNDRLYNLLALLAALSNIAEPAIRQREALQSAIDGVKVKVEEFKKDFQAGIQGALTAGIDAISQARERSTFLRGGTSEQGRERLAALADEKAAIESQLPGFRALASVSADAAKQVNVYETRLREIDGTTKDLTNNIIPLINARELEAERIADVIGAFAELSKARDKAAENTRKLGEDIEDIETKSYQDRADLALKFNDTLLEIAEKTAQGAEDRLRKLEQQRGDIARTFGQGELDAERKAAEQELEIRISAAREEAKAARDHTRALQEIRISAQQREFDFLLNRDAAGLFRSRMQEQFDLQKEGRDFVNAGQERQIDTGEKGQDLGRTLEQERQARLLSYGRQLEELKRNFDRQEQEQLIQDKREAERNRVARANDLRDLDIALNRQREARRLQYNRESELLRSSTKTQLDIIANFAGNAVKFVMSLNPLTSVFSSVLQGILSAFRTPVRRADGGSLFAGQTSFVNDDKYRSTESYNGVRFPPGLGIFTPLQSGTVTPGGGGTNNSMGGLTINIMAAREPQMTANAVVDLIDQRFNGRIQGIFGAPK